MLVQINKPGFTFNFPDEPFYKALKDGSFLSEHDTVFLQKLHITLADVESALRDTFSRIAVRISPHAPVSLRKAELQTALKQCRRNAPRIDLGEAQHPLSLASRYSEQSIGVDGVETALPKVRALPWMGGMRSLGRF